MSEHGEFADPTDQSDHAATLPRTVGVIGLGVLGRIMVSHLRRVADVVVHDVDQNHVDGVIGDRVHPAMSPADVARRSEVVLLSLPSPAAVLDVITGHEGIVAAGSAHRVLVIDTSTVAPETNIAMHAACAAAGVDYLEAPVSGGEPFGTGEDGARKATLTFMAGGEQAAFTRAIPVFAVLGSHWFLLGPAGSGTTIKLASNLCSGLHALVAAEALALAARSGISPAVVRQVFEHTDAKSYFFTDYVWPRFEQASTAAGFAVKHQLKDHRLAQALAAQSGLDLPLNDAAVNWYAGLAEHGDADADVTIAVVRKLEAPAARRGSRSREST